MKLGRSTTNFDSVFAGEMAELVATIPTHDHYSVFIVGIRRFGHKDKDWVFHDVIRRKSKESHPDDGKSDAAGHFCEKRIISPKLRNKVLFSLIPDSFLWHRGVGLFRKSK
nr:hypothetical protein [Sicyoidochytrium minutum DNA virus]